jgi:DNA primase large subunit
MKIKIKDFMPKSKENESANLIREALDWAKHNQISSGTPSKEVLRGRYADFKPIKLEIIKEEDFPPCVKNILNGLSDGKKRALFVLLNFFRSIGMEKEEIEKKINEWNKKNENPLKDGYVKAQLLWAYNNRPILPPNCKEFYQGIGVCKPDELCSKIKNPVNYTVRKNMFDNKDNKKNKKQNDKEFKKEVRK